MPSIIMAMGSVARPGSGLSCWPTTPLSVITVIDATMNNTWLVTRMATFCFSRLTGAIAMLSMGREE
ncbi:hypothetical protein [Halomonas chromatireducens]|uniref:hypothetical protein n=1 Tax=Halomonas chromatireducens TaxID=507626 RepID=UPI00082E123E|nr:hypothetical protein [Halomonas chromatireducens]